MANDFSGDSSCVALYRLESGALTTDSIGSNTLTDNNTVGVDTSDYKEGAGCADFESSNGEYLSIADADLDSGVPFKSGETNRIFTICFWTNLESSDHGGWVSKYNTSSARSFSIRDYWGDRRVNLFTGYNSGGSYERVTHSSQLTVAQWYHVCVALDGRTGYGDYRIRIWDDTAADFIAADVTGSVSNEVSITTADLTVGRSYGSYERDGKMDEVVIFDRVLTTTEMDEIRSGTFSAGGATYTLTADAGSMALTGSAADLFFNRSLVAGAGSMTLTGQDASLNHNRVLGCDPGAITLTGQDASLFYNRRLLAEAGTIDLTGFDATLTYTPISGPTYTLTAEAGSLALNGSDAGLFFNRALSAEPGSVELTGADASLLFNRLLTADGGSITLTGLDASLVYSGAGLPTYTLTAEAGALTLSGADAGLLYNRVLGCDPGALNLTGQDADLLFNRLLSADPGAIALTGADATLLKNYAISAEPGTIILTGQNATLTYSGATVAQGVVTISLSASKPGAAITGARPATTITAARPGITIN